MSVVMRLEYEAVGPSIRVEVDAINDQGVTVIGGAPMPARHITLTKLAAMDPELEADFRSVLARLEPLVRAKAEEDAADPARLREEANRIASERQALERAKGEAAAAVDAAIVEAKRIEIEANARREELAKELADATAAHEVEMQRLAADAAAKRAEAEEFGANLAIMRAALSKSEKE